MRIKNKKAPQNQSETFYLSHSSEKSIFHEVVQRHIAVQPLRFIGTTVLYSADLDRLEPQHVPLRLVNCEEHPCHKVGLGVAHFSESVLTVEVKVLWVTVFLIREHFLYGQENMRNGAVEFEMVISHFCSDIIPGATNNDAWATPMSYVQKMKTHIFKL